MRFRVGALMVLSGFMTLVHPDLSSAEAPTEPLDNGRGRVAAPVLRLPLIPVPAVAAPDAIRSRSDNGLQPEAVQYFTHPEDVSIIGSNCVGLDCTGAESFGFDTIRMKENNVRIKFDDTSAIGGFPYKDWSIGANDSNNGGANMFWLTNDTDGRMPFVVMDDAPTHALRLRGEFVGFGPAVPAAKIHASLGDTPTLRLDQTAAGGYFPYVWDVAGNEAGFFVRDVTGGGGLPFRVLPGAPAHGLVAASTGVGIGTNTPAARLHLSNAAPTFVVTNTTTTTNTLSLDPGGNLTLSGLLFETSSRDAKENLTPVDADAMLDRVAGLSIYEWNYKTDDPSTTHVGPVAEDFAAAFGLGKDDRHIAALDASGVALGAIKALARGNQAKDARIADLERRLSQQGAEIERLSEQLKALLERTETH